MKSQYTLTIGSEIYAMAFLMPGYDERPTLFNRIFVVAKYRGIGLGSALLNLICKLADEEHETLMLSIEPDFNSPLQIEQLEDWYRRASFEYVNNDPHDYTMVREPKG